jgi:DNA mismatch repair protein MutL
MPDIIKLLPDSVANQIAAGEVIQRPASVIKELVENSIDAGGRNISVIIKDSGKTLIQVTDDGNGMSETDARLSFERHATSKITSAGDLFTITTKGFRGEALASIAAVAMVELKTRKPDSETGTRIVISGSRVEIQEPCSTPIGSSFSVKNLFYNIPARRKFLKTDTTELRHIVNEFQKIVIAHPDIRFTLYHNDSEIYVLPPANYRQRIIGVFGKQINQELISLETETSLINVRGFIGKPESARKTYGEQFFFVNNRYMKHPYFHKAVVEAYQNILPAEAIPSYFIFLEADPATIDINIHPTKTEIKFEDERALWQIIMASVREALGRFNIVPSIDFENEALIDIPIRNSGDSSPIAPSIAINPDFNPFNGEEVSYPGKPESPRESGSGNVRNWEKLYDTFEKQPGRQTEKTETISEKSRKFFQVRGRYIACPVRSGLMLLDQHRAHERVLFEKFLECLGRRSNVSQSDLFPITIELNPSDYLVLKEIEDDIRILGFDLDTHIANMVTIKGRPAEISGGDPAEILEIIIEDFKSRSGDPSADSKEKLAAGMASASAIPYGRELSQHEMENLFDTLFACSAPNYSPKGKPVVIILTMEELEKKFK